LIIGKDQGSAIGTLVERQTRMTRLLYLRQRDGDTLHDALTARMGGLPAGLLRSITWDQAVVLGRSWMDHSSRSRQFVRARLLNMAANGPTRVQSRRGYRQAGSVRRRRAGGSGDRPGEVASGKAGNAAIGRAGAG
jgi:hypothetical protein